MPYACGALLAVIVAEPNFAATYVVDDSNGNYSHGKTIAEARSALIYKLSSRDTTEFKKWTTKTTVTLADAIRSYRAITGACEAGTRHFCEQSGNLPDNLTIADINGDGKLDLVNISSGGNNLGLLLGNGNGTFQAVRSINVGNLTYGDVVAGDWNGDGKLDLAVTNNTSTQVLRGDGTGGFGAPVSYTAGGVTLITADLDNDGKADLASASANQVNLLLGNGDGTFKTVVRFPTGTGPYRMTSADLNNDGKIDLLVSTSGNFSVLMNTSM